HDGRRPTGVARGGSTTGLLRNRAAFVCSACPRCPRVLRRTATRTATKIELSRTSSEGTNLPQRRVDFLRRGEQARREPRIPGGIRGHTGDDPALLQTVHHFLWRRPVDLEADDTGRVGVGRRRLK